MFSEVIIQANTLFIFRDLLNFTAKDIGGQIKAFIFFCTAGDAKSTKYIYGVTAKQQTNSQQTHLVCLHAVEK